MRYFFKLFFITTILSSLTILVIPFSKLYKANYIEFYDKNGELIKSEIHNNEAQYIYLEEMPNHLKYAFIAFEDKNFYEHHGFDTLRIIKSFFNNLTSGNLNEGGSTITQQYARTVLLNNNKSLLRKIKEAYYTIKLEKTLSKDTILEGYLNSIYLGHGCYGVEAASNFYFGKSAKDLTLAESATLASLASSPSSSSPFVNPTKSKERRRLVLKALKEEKFISILEYKSASTEALSFNHNSRLKANIEYYLDEARKEINLHRISLTKGLKVYLNIDLSLYEKVNAIIQEYSLDSQLSLVILENKSNRILFDIGGIDYNLSNYNRSIYSKRQIGSTIKTFLYSLALENDFSLTTSLKSEKLTFNIKNYGEYSPSNAGEFYANKDINMLEAFAVSDNIYATKTLLLLGSDNFVSYLSRFNLRTTNSVPSIALGTCEFTLLELVKAYSIYANDGYSYKYEFIDKITDSLNNLLYKSKNIKKLIVNKSVLESVKTLLSTPFKNNDYYIKPTLANYDFAGYYGKSGSTSSDSYLIIFNNTYTIGIWIGNDDNSRLHDYSSSKTILQRISQTI